MSDDSRQPMRRRLSASERRLRILEAATEVFAERGYGDAAMGEIAARAGVVASVIYDHFSSKRDLHIELLELHGEALIERSIAEVGGDTPEKLLRASIEAFYRFVEQDPFAWRFLFREPPSDAEIAAAHRAIHDRATAGIAGLIEANSPPGADGLLGAPRAQASWMLARASQAATESLAHWWWEHREVPREQVVEVVHGLLWSGFARLLILAGEPRPVAATRR
jgi:AcrR family transcriptional regulator